MPAAGACVKVSEHGPFDIVDMVDMGDQVLFFLLECLLARGSLKLLLVVSCRPLARGGFPGAEPRKPPACLVSYSPLTSPRSPKIQRKLTRLPHHLPPSTIPFTISCKSNTEAPPGTYPQAQSPSSTRARTSEESGRRPRGSSSTTERRPCDLLPSPPRGRARRPSGRRPT